MRCAVAVAGPTAPLPTGRRRRSATASSAGPSAPLYGKVSSALRQASRIRLTGCSSTVPASRFIAAPAAEKGGPGPMPPWYRPHRRRAQHRAPRRPRPQGPPHVLSIASCSRRTETCMIARSHSAASRPCRHPPNLSPTKAVKAGNCANGLKSAGPGPSSRRERTARSDIPTTGHLHGARYHRTHVLPPQRPAAHRNALRAQH